MSQQELPDKSSQSIPKYMREVYTWAYIDPRWVPLLDRGIVVKTLLFGNDTRLMRAYLDRVRPGTQVWQIAHVYGDLVNKVARKVGSNGHFDVTDVTPIQVEHANAKLSGMPWARVTRADAATYESDRTYDLVCSFMLLHEVPDTWKRAIVDNALKHMKDDGEVIFVDYHRPAAWQPIGLILKLVNRLLEPFAEALWHHEIFEYATHPEDYTWEKRTIFGGVYQVVIVKRIAQ
jgi:SAM-dependent methyltransferase